MLYSFIINYGLTQLYRLAKSRNLKQINCQQNIPERIIISEKLKFEMIKKQVDKLNASIIIEMTNNQFPFGQHPHVVDYDQTKKIYVRKRNIFRNQKQKSLLIEKLATLKGIYHRNVINIRSYEQYPDHFAVLYNYVPLAIQNAFEQIDKQTFKEIHKQLIQLAIHLAKNYILTSFNPNRCGVVFVEGKFIIKYYLPLNQIVITQNISMLERSVQLFKVQAMHMLDILSHQVISDLNNSHEQEIMLKSSGKNSVQSLGDEGRTLSNQTLKIRKFSKLSQIKRRRSQDSTTVAEARLSGLKESLKLIKMKSQNKRKQLKSRQKIRERVQLLRIRSAKAIKIFLSIKRQIDGYVSLSNLIRLCYCQ